MIRQSPAAMATMPAKSTMAMPPRRIIQATPFSYRSVVRPNQRLKAWKKRPGILCSRLRMSTHSDGVSVSATMPEITTAMEIVTANWR